MIVSGPLSYTFEGSPGEEMKGSLTLHNQDDKPQKVSFQFFDYPYFDEKENGYEYPEVGTDKRSNASWFELEKDHVLLGAQSSYELKYKVKFPKENSLQGSYYSILMVEPVLDELKYKEDKPLVRSVVRYALHMVTSLKGSGTFDLKMEKKHLDEEKKVFSFEVSNVGSKHFRPDVILDLYSESGDKLEPIRIAPTWIMPDKQKKFDIDVSHLKKGKYQGLILFDQKDADFFGAEVAFSIP